MLWWRNAETKETRRAAHRPAGFGWILAPDPTRAPTSSVSDGGDVIVQGVATVIADVAISLLTDDEDSSPSESTVTDVFSGLGGDFGGGGSSDDW